MQVRDELIATRKMIADIQNEALAMHGHDARVDHRSHRERGIGSAPERHLGQERIRQMSAADKTKYLADRKQRSGPDSHPAATQATFGAAASL
jgi:hypothetical protein